MRRTILLLAIALAAAPAGCDVDSFGIEMTPRQERIERTFSAQRGARVAVETKPAEGQAPPLKKEPPSLPRSLSKEDLASLEKIYGKPLVAGEKLTATFGDTLPNDLGNSGSYLYWPTAMGSASVYVERFRGNPDQAAALQDKLAKADKLVDHLIGWLTMELGKEPGFAQLKAFLGGDFRKDVHNLVLMNWTANGLMELTPQTDFKQAAAPQAEVGRQVMLVRMLQYLMERGYFTRSQVPMVWRSGDSGDAPSPLLGLIQRLMATKMGVPADQPVPQSLARLVDPEFKTAEASLKRYLEGTPEYRELLRQWQEKRKAEAQAEPPKVERVEPKQPESPPDPMNVLQLSEILGDARDGSLLAVSLATGLQPWLTNGVWEAKEGKVQWVCELPGETAWPRLLTAMWSQPEEVFQKEHFGQVVLSGENLHWFCMWRRGLTEAEGKQWDAFVAALKPGPELKGLLSAFRFAGEPTQPSEGQEKPPESYAHTAVDLILKAFPEKP